MKSYKEAKQIILISTKDIAPNEYPTLLALDDIDLMEIMNTRIDNEY